MHYPVEIENINNHCDTWYQEPPAGIYLIEFHEKNQIVKIDLPESFNFFKRGFSRIKQKVTLFQDEASSKALILAC